MVDNGPALVSEWMDNGTMSEYLAKNPSVNKLGMVGTHSFFQLNTMN